MQPEDTCRNLHKTHQIHAKINVLLFTTLFPVMMPRPCFPSRYLSQPKSATKKNPLKRSLRTLIFLAWNFPLGPRVLRRIT